MLHKLRTFKLRNKINLFADKLLNSLSANGALSERLILRLENLVIRLKSKEIRFLVEKGRAYAVENEKRIMISNLRRGFWLYRNGINERANFLYKSYCLENISFRKGDIVIDCGANSGDLFLALQELIISSDYFAFEPNPIEFEILQCNVGRCGGRIYNIALGDAQRKMKFYISTREGDSSLVEPFAYDELIEVDVVRLDNFIIGNNLDSIKLLKLEAEGYEPEILHGLGECLKYIEYIALDGGYERGIDKEQTFITCSNYLLNNGFEWVDMYHPWSRLLFRNKQYVE
jgi:FkbM family methyltransferase